MATVSNSHANERKVMKCLEECIWSYNVFTFNSHKFRDLLRKVKPIVNLGKLRNEESLNLLEVIILHGKDDLLNVLFELGIWKDLFPDITENKKYLGLTAWMMAHRMMRTKMCQEILRINEREKAMTAFHIAIRDANLDRFKSLIKEMDVTFSDKYALHFAMIGGNAEILEYLMERRFRKFLYMGNTHQNLMRLAICYGHTELIPTLVSKYGFDPNQVIHDHGNNYTLLQIAAHHGHMRALTMLLSVGAIFPKNILLHACVSKDISFMANLMSIFCLDINYPNKYGQRLIHLAALYGLDIVVANLLRWEVDLYSTDACNSNVIHYACRGENTTVLIKILAALKDSNKLKCMIDEQQSYTGAETLFCVILKDVKENRSIWEYIHVRRKLVGCFGRHIQAKNAEAIRTEPVGSSVSRGYIHMEKKFTNIDLYHYRARYKDFKLNCRYDLTPLMVAILSANYHLVPIILKYHSLLNLNKSDALGFTAFEHACIMGDIQTVKLLVRISSNMVNISKCIGLAKDNGHDRLIYFLKKLKYARKVALFTNHLQWVIAEKFKEEHLSMKSFEVHDFNAYLRNQICQLGECIMVYRKFLDVDKETFKNIA